ncbi:MAG: MFS transporter [Gemmatimonadaceae bacterium]
MTARSTPPQSGVPGAPIGLGLRENADQFALLVLVNAFVGAMVGMERTVLPLLAEHEFGLASKSAALSFIASFGVVKAITNLFAGRLSDRFGRRGVLIAGWCVGVPVPMLLMWAPSWAWVVVANLLLGVNQGLAWSTTVIMKIDLVGPRRRGLAMGLNEFAGYVAVALTALGTGYLAATHGLRPVPFVVGLVVAVAGLGLSVFAVRETRHHVAVEAAAHPTSDSMREDDTLTPREVFARTSWRDRALSTASHTGLVNNLNDGLAWGLFPLFFAAAGLDTARIGVLTFAYPFTWGVLQLATGALSDRVGRKWLIASGMLVQGAALGAIALTRGFTPWLAAAIALGVGTAMVYPTLLASIGDVAHPRWRGGAVGVYRLWRDSGYAVGALVAGLLADRFGMAAAIGIVAVITAASGLEVATRMPETGRRDTRVR